VLLRIYLPIYFLLFIIIAFVIPNIRVYKQTGINPVTFGKSDNAHDYLGKVMKVLIAITMLSVILFSLQWDFQFLTSVHYINNYWLQVFGLILFHLALLWVIIAQYQMNIISLGWVQQLAISAGARLTDRIGHLLIHTRGISGMPG
jgi:hypothetical protein